VHVSPETGVSTSSSSDVCSKSIRAVQTTLCFSHGFEKPTENFLGWAATSLASPSHHHEGWRRI